MGKREVKIYYNEHEDSYEFSREYGNYEFNKDHLVELPIRLDYEEDNDMKILNEIYGVMNFPKTNPLAKTSEKEGHEGQKWLKENMKNPHTSMSIGDAIEIDGTLYVVSKDGFTKIES